LPAGFLEIKELKARSEDVILEGKDILKESAGHHLVLLTENGKQRDSVQFAKWLGGLIESPKPVALVIGGAAGFSSEVKDQAQEMCSLSLLTYPHKFARVLLVEQLYRAHTILTGHPYHK
tara:strand:+ start:1852 stop:2211 length:360 start_codon:yes stop_codon:yes gene_type:complete